MVYSCVTQYGWGGGLTMIFMGLFWILIIALAIWAIIKFAKKENFSEMISNKNPLEIIKERYAKGEISKTKFEEMKKELSKR